MDKHTQVVKSIKKQIKNLPCLHLVDFDTFKIIEIEGPEIGYGGILKQRKNGEEQLV